MGATSTKSSFFSAAILSIILFCIMQMQKSWFASSQLHTILGGYVGSILFILMLTAVGNFETLIFGTRFNTKLFPEVVLCMIGAMMASGLVHRVCTTTCLIFSMIGLYYMNKRVKAVTPAPVATVNLPSKKKK